MKLRDRLRPHRELIAKLKVKVEHLKDENNQLRGEILLWKNLSKQKRRQDGR